MSRIVSVVTGGAGFIGSHLVDVLLERGHEVRVVDDLSGGHKTNLDQHEHNPKLTCHWLDINTLTPDNAAFEGATYCFHLAGIGDIVPSIERPVQYMQTNVQGTIRVLEAARAANVKKFVYASSSSCYGLADTPTDEDHKIQPLYPYALSKYMGEMAVFHWGELYELPVNAICIFNAYGTRVRTTGAYGAVFGVFLKQKLAGKPFTVVGDGTQSRDFVYVTDVAKAFLAAAETDAQGERFNIGAGKPQSINYLVKLLGAEEINYVPKRPGEPDITFANIAKAQNVLGWQPEISFEEGVQKMLADSDRWNSAPLWDVDSISKATEKWFQYMAKA